MADNQIAFALEILKLLAEKPRTRRDLSATLSDLNCETGDISQKIVRTIAKLRKCGFEINSAPHHPYELVASSFPVILSGEQRQALALAAYFLSDMGFSVQASQIIQIGKLTEIDLPTNIKVNFSPPVDYGDGKLEAIMNTLQERFRQKRRYTIRYRSSQGLEQNWDCDRSELRFHNGSLYLFAFLPDFAPRFTEKRPSVEQNFAFRVDRVLHIYAPSTTPWGLRSNFPTLEIRYYLSGALGMYQPRRANERELLRDTEANFVEIVTQEDFLFWFRQRILQYGSNVKVLEPIWLAQQVARELERARAMYDNL